jgi:hypothetical protein
VSRGVLVALLAAIVTANAGCARLVARPRPPASHTVQSIVAAGAAREQDLPGMRLTLSVRATAGPPSARLASPAYLAIDGPDRLRLQVLSPFGVTVLDLATDGDTFTLTLPLRGESRQGRIDLEALAAGVTPEDERMIVALALLFRPKMRADRCTAAGAAAVSCTVATDLVATVTVDDVLRPIREEYVGPGGRTVLVSELTDYPDRGRHTLPGRITISDGQGGPALIVRVVRAKAKGAPA